MKNINRYACALFAVSILFVYSTALMADDAVQAAPNNYKIILENAKVRVLEFHGKKGDKIPMHTHPNYVSYFLTDGKGNFTSNGKTTEATMKKGKPCGMRPKRMQLTFSPMLMC